MFSFMVRYLGFLKVIPGAALVFECLLILYTWVTRPQLLDYFDQMKVEVLTWPGTTVTMHKYGGMQFNLGRMELGHIHGNGLLDMPFSRKMKQVLLAEGRVSHHHIFIKSGWISFYIRSDSDKAYAIDLIRRAYLKRGTL